MTVALLAGVLSACGADGADGDDADAADGAAVTEATDAPTETVAPAATDAPEVTAAPEPTDAPAATDAPAQGVAASITEFDFGGGDYYFDTRGVTELPAGPVRATMTIDDASTEAHVAMFARVKDGETVQGVLDAAGSDFTGWNAAQKVDFFGGINALTAGESQTSIVDLAPGTYILACFIPAQDGSFPPQPHSALGMWSEIEVVEPEVERVELTAEEVGSEGTIVMNEMDFILPDGFDGNGTFEVVNEGELLHEMGIVKLKEGKTGEDVAEFYDFTSGPPQIGNEPDTPGGGFAANHPGNDGFVELALDPGTYVLVCFVGNEPPSFATHLNEGMWLEFEVT